MQTFFELEQKLLNQHHAEFKAFTRLPLSLSVGSITLLIAVLPLTQSIGFLSKLSLLSLFGSVAFGVLVQHRLMMEPFDHLHHAQTALAVAEENQDESPIELRRKPSITMQRLYKFQLGTFAFSFLLLATYSIYVL